MESKGSLDSFEAVGWLGLGMTMVAIIAVAAFVLGGTGQVLGFSEFVVFGVGLMVLSIVGSRRHRRVAG